MGNLRVRKQETADGFCRFTLSLYSDPNYSAEFVRIWLTWCENNPLAQTNTGSIRSWSYDAQWHHSQSAVSKVIRYMSGFYLSDGIHMLKGAGYN